MRMGFSGLLGGGKTLLMTIFGKGTSLEGQKVYSNYRTSFSDLISPMDLVNRNENLKNCSLCLDELYAWIDSRTSGTTGNRLITYFGLQTRKIDVNLFYTAQLIGSIDLRLRYITDIVVLCERRKKGFSYTFFYGYQPIRKVFLKEEKAKQFYNDYDTSEEILPLELDADVIDFDIVLDIYKIAPTKKTFVVMLKKQIPFISLDMCSAVYDLLLNNQHDVARKLIG